ncbi:MAG: hypothetical protein AAF171_21505 [Cyanobacteria bacterium P01_A01_bin.116]
MSNEDFRLAETVMYDAETREFIMTLKDGSLHTWPIRLLEMVQSTPDAWFPLEDITDQQLVDVAVYGGGKYILWDGLDQSFSVVDLLNGIYGREEWMRSLMATAE